MGLRIPLSEEMLGADLVEHAVGNVWYDKKSKQVQCSLTGKILNRDYGLTDDGELENFPVFNGTRKRKSLAKMANILSIAASFNTSLTARVDSLGSNTADSKSDHISSESQQKTKSLRGSISKKQERKSLPKKNNWVNLGKSANQKRISNLPQTTMNGVTSTSPGKECETEGECQSPDFWFSLDEGRETKQKGKANPGYDSLHEEVDSLHKGNPNKTPIKLCGRQGSGASIHEGSGASIHEGFCKEDDNMYSLPMERMDGVGDENPHFSTYM